MGGCRCSYKTCPNTTKTRENLHFFHYPVRQKDRCKQWIENAQKPHFYNLDEDQLRNKVVCETHFEDNYFPNSQKKRLMQGAIPTLDGDCVERPLLTENSIKIQDIQVLPANADGTLFVLETQNNFHSEKVESYIYTNNGLVLPIRKCGNDTLDDTAPPLYNNVETVDEEQPVQRLQVHQESLPEIVEEKSQDVNYANDQYGPDRLKSKRSLRIKEQESRKYGALKLSDDLISKALGSKYVKKIEQHSKDIAILKRILRSRTRCRRPTNAVILHTLKSQIPTSLFSLINLYLNEKCEVASEELDFFATLYSTSPQLYHILSQKYEWKLPDFEVLPNAAANKNNGHVYCGDN